MGIILIIEDAGKMNGKKGIFPGGYKRYSRILPGGHFRFGCIAFLLWGKENTRALLGDMSNNLKYPGGNYSIRPGDDHEDAIWLGGD